MSDSILPKSGVNPYANHPGFDASGCPIRSTITQQVNGFVRGGFGCEITGGHCLPGEHCDFRRAEAKRQDEMSAMIAKAKFLEKV